MSSSLLSSEQARAGVDPTVTVVVATYNCAFSLQYTLKSILAQTFQDFEVWVIGDACTDHTSDVVAALQDARVQFYNRTRNSGSQALPNQDGIERARGKYIAYLGHDDLWFPWHLQEMVKSLESQQADLVHAMCARILPDGLQSIWGALSLGSSYRLVHIPPSCMLHRREVGQWNDADQLMVGTDVDFLRQIHLKQQHILFHARLGVLKFPSAEWKSYDPAAPKPQQHFWNQLAAQPETLEKDLLQQAAVLLSQKHRSLYNFQKLQHQLKLEVRVRLLEFFLDHCKWLHPAMVVYNQKKRRNKRSSRGLS